jgi:hypothetical protein
MGPKNTDLAPTDPSPGWYPKVSFGATRMQSTCTILVEAQNDALLCLKASETVQREHSVGVFALPDAVCTLRDHELQTSTRSTLLSALAGTRRHGCGLRFGRYL